MSLFNFVIGCSSPDKSINTEESSKTKVISVMSGKDTLSLLDSLKKNYQIQQLL